MSAATSGTAGATAPDIAALIRATLAVQVRRPSPLEIGVENGDNDSIKFGNDDFQPFLFLGRLIKVSLRERRRSSLMTKRVNDQSANDGCPSVGDGVAHIRTLLKRNLAEVFGEADPARRRKVIAEIYAKEAVVHVPSGVIIGRDALDKFAGDLKATHSHYVYTPSGEPQVLHDSARLAWGSGPKGEPPAYTGEDIIVVRDGRISALYVYLDALPV
jgi:hypothetical protein